MLTPSYRSGLASGARYPMSLRPDAQICEGSPGTLQDLVQLSPQARRATSPSGFPRMRAGDLPPCFSTTSHTAGSANGPGRPRRDESSIRGRIRSTVQQMWSNVAKAIAGFSKAIPHLGAKGDVLRQIINVLRGFDGLASALTSGNIKGLLSSAKSFGSAVQAVVKKSKKARGFGFLMRRGGAFIPVLGTAVAGASAAKALEKSEKAARDGNQVAAGVYGGAAALHTLSATLSGCVDLLLALSGGTAGPAYGVLNGVVSGLGAMAEIAGGLVD